MQRLSFPFHLPIRLGYGVALGLLAATLLIAGCQSSDSPASPGPDGETPDGASDLCPSHPYAMTPRFIEGDTEHTDVIRSMRADGQHIFFSNLDDVFRLPAAGGDPVRVLDGNKSGISPEHILLVNGRFFLSGFRSGIIGANVLLELPRTGTTLTTIVDSIPVAAGESPYDVEILSMDDANIYWSTELTSRNGVSIPFDARPTVIHRMPWAGGAAATLATLESENDGYQRAGERLLLLQVPFNDSDKSAQLISLPVSGGAPVVVADFPDGADLLDADGGHAYLYVSKFGLARQPLAGGPKELLTTQFYPPYRIWADPDRLLIFDYGQVKPGSSPIDNFAYGVFSQPLAGGASSLVTCLDLTSSTVHASTRDGKHLYVSTYKSGTGENGIFHITLP